MKRQSNLAMQFSIKSDLRDDILEMKIPRASLIRFDREEKKKEAKGIYDLRDIESKSESTVFTMLNALMLHKQYFVYSGPLLLNVNPGPSDRNYLNLDKWMQNVNNELIDLERKGKKPSEQQIVGTKPHIYGFIDYVYKTMVQENASQTVNMIGNIASGKTFNLIHSLEYICQIACDPSKNKTIEVFDTMHKAVQLIHILGSIFRHNNLESSSCGLKINLGFNDDNYISSFNLESEILDVTLPFSDSGRSFSILHAIIAGSSQDVKKMLEFTDVEENLVFFRKFYKSFDKQQQDRFKLNDLEIWNKFHSLLNYFLFTKQEVVDIIQLLSVVILANELAVGKYNSKENSIETLFKIFKGPTSRKIAVKLGISEEDFLNKASNFKSITQIKDFVSNLMKKCYQSVFEYVKNKLHTYLKMYFHCYNNSLDFGVYLESLGIIVRTNTATSHNIQTSSTPNHYRTSSFSNNTTNNQVNHTHIINNNNYLSKVNNSSIQTVIAVTTVNNNTINYDDNNGRKSITNKNRSSSVIGKGKDKEKDKTEKLTNNRNSFKINYSMFPTNTNQVQTVNQTTQTNLVKNILDIGDLNKKRQSKIQNQNQILSQNTNSNVKSTNNNVNSTFVKDTKNNITMKSDINYTTNNKENEKQKTEEKQNGKYICFIDFPGEIMDSTLGGFVTNLANECLNSYASSQYSSINEKLTKEGISIRYFQKLHTKDVIEELLSENGFLNNIDNYISNPDSRKNSKIIEWGSNKQNAFFKCNFTTNSVTYDLNVLRNEINSIISNNTTESIFKSSENSILKWSMKNCQGKLLSKKKTFQAVIRSLVSNLLKDLKGIHPFVVYCLHSKYSLKNFQGIDKFNDLNMLYSNTQGKKVTNQTGLLSNIEESKLLNYFGNEELYDDNLVPYKSTIHLMRRSLIMSVLYWEWFGFHEWIAVDNFINLFIDDFLFIKNTINTLKIQIRKFNTKIPEINLDKMSKYEKASCILSTFTEANKYVIGQEHILFKSGVLQTIAKNINALKSKYREESQKRASMATYKKSIHGVLMMNTTFANVSNRRQSSNKVLKAKTEGGVMITNQSNNNYNKTTYSNISNNLKSNPINQNTKITHITSKGNNEVNDLALSQSNSSEGNLLKFVKGFDSMADSNKRRSLKVQCHLNYIESTTQTKSAFIEEESPNTELFDMLEGNYQAISNKKISEFTPSNKEFLEYNKQNNVVVPKQEFFDRVKRMLFEENSYKIFSYDENKDQIITIQSAWKGYVIRLKYKTFRCVIGAITRIQCLVKGVLLRKKFRRYIQILYSTIFIQRMYKYRHKRRIEAVSKLQSQIKVFLFRVKVKSLIEKRKKQKVVTIQRVAKKVSGTLKDLKGYSRNEEGSEYRKTNQNNQSNQPQLHDDTFDIEGTLEEIKGLDPTTRSLLDKLENLKSNKDNTNSPSRRNKKDISQLNSEAKPILKRDNVNKKMRSSEIVSFELSNLDGIENKNRIIDNLMHNMGSFVYNEHINRGTRGSISNYCMYDLSSMGLLKRPNNKVEDKLIEYGKNLKHKIEATKHEKDKKYLEEFTFQPTFQTKQRKITQGKLSQPTGNFYERQKAFIKNRAKKVDDKKAELKDPDQKELTFKPAISKFAQENFEKRSINDLYKWQEKVDKDKKLKSEQKELKEKEEIAQSIAFKHKTSKNSEVILKNKKFNQSAINDSMVDKNNEELESNLNTGVENTKVKDPQETQNILDRVMNNNDITIEEDLDLWPVKKI